MGKIRILSLAVAVVGGLVLQPIGLEAQCVVTSTSVQSFPPTISVTKSLSTSGTCRSVGNNNVLGCFPSAAPVFTMFLVAAANTAATNPSCSWVCSCGGVSTPITITSSDGLPVELMEYSVE